jgi:hypothetical protein
MRSVVNTQRIAGIDTRRAEVELIERIALAPLPRELVPRRVGGVADLQLGGRGDQARTWIDWACRCAGSRAAVAARHVAIVALLRACLHVVTAETAGCDEDITHAVTGDSAKRVFGWPYGDPVAGAVAYDLAVVMPAGSICCPFSLRQRNAPSGLHAPSRTTAAPRRARHSHGTRDISPACRNDERGAARRPSICRRQ